MRHGLLPNSHAYARSCYPIGSAFTPVPKRFVRVPRFFPAFFPPRCTLWSLSLTVQVRFVRGTSPSPEVVEKRCGCNVSCGTVSTPCFVTAFRVRRVCEVTISLSDRRVKEKNKRGAYTLRRELLIAGFDLRQSGVSLPTASRGELDVDPSTVEFGLVQAQAGLQRGPRREFEERTAFGLGHYRASTGDLGCE